MQGQKHAQTECERRNAQPVEEQSQHGTYDIEYPRSVAAHHHGLDDTGHGVGLRSGKTAGAEAVHLVEHQHYGTYGSGRHESTQEFPRLLRLGRGAEPVAYL